MKTIRKKTIDGIEIIDRFDTFPIGPEETKANCKPIIAKLKEKQDVDSKIKEYNRELARSRTYRIEALGIYKHVGEQLKILDPKKQLTRDDIINSMTPELRKGFTDKERLSADYAGVARTKENDLKELSEILREKEKEILKANPITSGLRFGEELKPDAEIEDLKAKFFSKSETQQLKPDGTYIDDFRGKSYNKKSGGEWSKAPIIKLGADKPTGSKWDEELTEVEKTEISDQNENERLEDLTPEEKTAEYNSKVSGLANQAQAMENELKFSKDVDYQTKAQAFYDSEISELKTKYS